MPKTRLSRTEWQAQREKVYQKDKGKCQGPYCKDKNDWSITLNECHIDHIQSGKLASNKVSNLRVLCPYCHALRLDSRHSGLRGKAIKKGIIPPDYRELLWE